MTISKAYSFLEKEEVVERRPGKPLVVKPLGKDQIMTKKIDQLRQSLSATVRIVQQLGITREAAIHLFGQMLDDEYRET